MRAEHSASESSDILGWCSSIKRFNYIRAEEMYILSWIDPIIRNLVSLKTILIGGDIDGYEMKWTRKNSCAKALAQDISGCIISGHRQGELS